MPLLQINYSANIEADIDISRLAAAVHEAGLATGHIKTAALRTMARPWRTYVIADGKPENAFVHIIARVKAREKQAMKEIGDAVFKVLTDFMEEQYRSRPLSLSLEIIEIDTWRRNNIHERMEQKG